LSNNFLVITQEVYGVATACLLIHEHIKSLLSFLYYGKVAIDKDLMVFENLITTVPYSFIAPEGCRRK